MDGFVNVCAQVVHESQRAFGMNRRHLPVIRLSQRHYKGMKKAFVDGDMSVDLRVALEKPTLGIRSQPYWLDAAYRLVTDRKGANIQLQVGVRFPHEEELLNKKGPIHCIEAAWIACKPVVDVLMDRR